MSLFNETVPAVSGYYCAQWKEHIRDGHDDEIVIWVYSERQLADVPDDAYRGSVQWGSDPWDSADFLYGPRIPGAERLRLLEALVGSAREVVPLIGHAITCASMRRFGLVGDAQCDCLRNLLLIALAVLSPPDEP